MLRELVPFKRTVVVVVNLLEQLDQVAHQMRLGVFIVSLGQVMKHDLHKLEHAEALLAVGIPLKVILDLGQVSVVQVADDVVLFKVLVGLALLLAIY